MNKSAEGMELTEFYKRRAAYTEATKSRDLERMNLGSGADDTPWYIKILEEMVIDLILRVEKMENLMEPAPEEEVVPEGRKPKFT